MGPPPDPLIGTDLGPYRLLTRIGAGATGVVYRAAKPGRRQRLALEVLHRELGAIGGLEGRYRREARVLSRLSHPNIVKMLDFGAAAGRTYLAMEQLLGEPLEDRLLRAPRSPEQ